MKLDGVTIAVQSQSNRAHSLTQAVRRWWSSLAQLRSRRLHRLRLCESLSLGERRFIAVIEFDRARFLVGGTASSLVLLSQLPDESPSENRQPNLGAEERR